MKRTALTPWRGIAMSAAMVLLSLGACKKDASMTPEETATQANLSKLNFKSTTLATALTSYKSSPVVNYTGKSNITISGLAITGGSVPCISLTNKRFDNCRYPAL
jgi:hypothetical protein